MANIFDDILKSLKSFTESQNAKAQQNQQKQMQVAQAELNKAQNALNEANRKPVVPKQNTLLNKAQEELNKAAKGQMPTISLYESPTQQMNKQFTNVYDSANEASKQIGGALSAAYDLKNKKNEGYKQATGHDLPDIHVLKTLGKTLNAVSDSLESTTDYVGQKVLDMQYTAHADFDEVKAKMQSDPGYKNKLVDSNGNLIDYSGQIAYLEEKAKNPYTRNKEVTDQLKALKEIQNDQDALMYSTYYDYLEKNGASQEQLNEYKQAVVENNKNAIERAITYFGSTVEGYVGNFVKGSETLYQLASKTLGVDYEMGGFADSLIDNSEQLQSLVMSNASDAERAVYEIYGSMSPFLYSLLTAGVGGGNVVGDAAATEALTSRALLLSDVGVLGSTMKKNIEAGYDYETAVTNAFLHAGLSHITEAIGGEGIANILTGKIGEEMITHGVWYIVRSLANQFVAEATEEGMEAVIEPLIDKYTLNTGLTVEDYYDQVFSEDTVHQMIMGGIGGLLMGGGATAVNAAGYNSQINQLFDTIKIENSADYNAAQQYVADLEGITKRGEENIRSKNRQGLDTETDVQQLLAADQVKKAYRKKIADYRRRNPYSEAFTSLNDNVDLSLDNAEQNIINASRPTLSNRLEQITQLKNEVADQAYKAKETIGREKLEGNGVNVGNVDVASMSDQQIDDLIITDGYVKSLNRNVIYAELTDINGKTIDGLYDRDSDTIIVNPKANRGALSTLVHEMTHGSERSVFYDVLHNLVVDYYGEDAFEDEVKDIIISYSNQTELDEDGAQREVVARTVQDLLGKKDFVDRLVKYNNELAYRMYEEIKYLNEQTGTVDDIEQNFMRAFYDSSSEVQRQSDLEVQPQFADSNQTVSPNEKNMKKIAPNAFDKNGNLKRLSKQVSDYLKNKKAYNNQALIAKQNSEGLGIYGIDESLVQTMSLSAVNKADGLNISWDHVEDCINNPDTIVLDVVDGYGVHNFIYRNKSGGYLLLSMDEGTSSAQTTVNKIDSFRNKSDLNKYLDACEQLGYDILQKKGSTLTSRGEIEPRPSLIVDSSNSYIPKIDNEVNAFEQNENESDADYVKRRMDTNLELQEGIADRSNFYWRTDAIFNEVDKVPDNAIAVNDTYTSDSGSKYYFTPEGVYRVSDHWGLGINTCNWMLEDNDTNMNGPVRIGYAEWSDFVHNPLKINVNQEYDSNGNVAVPIRDMGTTNFSNLTFESGRVYIKNNGDYYILKPNGMWSKFNPKPIDNSTYNEVRYSISDQNTNNQERRKDLMAIHNLSQDNLMKSLDLGGLIMPSIAVTKDSMSHEGYGDVSLVFGKETIDPSNPDNRVYTRDAWTSRFPEVGYKLNSKEAAKVSKKINELVSRSVDPRVLPYTGLDEGNFNDLVNRSQGDAVKAYANDLRFKIAYLNDTDQEYRMPQKSRELGGRSRFENEVIKNAAGVLTESGYDFAKNENNEYILDEKTKNQIRDVVYDYYIGKYRSGSNNTKLSNEERAKRLTESTMKNRWTHWSAEEIVSDVNRYLEKGEYSVPDVSKASTQLEYLNNDGAYHKWLEGILNPMIEKKGIRNDTELYTRSGNRRSFEKLYEAYTPENILNRMIADENAESIGGYYNFNYFLGTSSDSFGSVQDIIDRENNIQLNENSKEEYDSLSNEYHRFVEEIESTDTADDYMYKAMHINGAFEEAIKKIKNRASDSSVKKSFSDWGLSITTEQIGKLKELIEKGRQLTTDYFEAKPRRIVTPSEIRFAVIPNDSSQEVRDRLNELGINTVEYDRNIEGDRQRKVSGLEGLQFSLSDQSDSSRILKDSYRSIRDEFVKGRIRNKTELNDALNSVIKDIETNGEVSNDSRSELYRQIEEASRSRTLNDNYDQAKAIRDIMGTRNNILPKDKWDITAKELSDSYGIPEFTNYEDARDYIKNYLDSMPKYEYLDPNEAGEISRNDLENWIDSKIDRTIEDIKERFKKKKTDEWKQKAENVVSIANIALNRLDPETGNELTIKNLDDILHQKKLNARTLEAIESTKEILKENVSDWVPGYDTIEAQYPMFSKETLSDAVYELLIGGELSGGTYDALANNISSQFDYEGTDGDIRSEINGFVRETLDTFENEIRYQAGEIDTTTVKKAIKVNEAYGGKDIEGEFKKRGYGTWLNEMAAKNKQELQAEYQPLTDLLIDHDGTVRETKSRPSDRKISHLKTFDQNLKALAGGNTEVYNALREKLRYGLLDKAASRIFSLKNDAQTKVVDRIKETGIVQGSKEDIAVQYILEGHTEEWIGDAKGNKNGFKAYTEEELKKNFDYEMPNGKKAYENILSAANTIRQSYMDLYEQITFTQLLANGDVEGDAEVKVAEAKTKVEQAWNTLKNIKDEIARNGTKESTQAAYEIQKKKFNTLVKQYNSLVEKNASGDLTRRQLTPFREDYSHHIQKRSLKNTLSSIRNADLAVPTELAGTSDYTNPNTAFSTISMAQDGHKYDPTALGSYTAYVNEAASLIGYNPVILELRQFNKDIKNTAQGTTLNKFSEYLNDYANMLAGKRNAIDRGVQKIVGAKTMKTIQALNSYAKGAALAMNFRSGLVQFANIPNGLGILQERGGASYIGDVAKGMRDYAAAIGKENTPIDQSAFLSNRFFDFDTGEKGFSKKFSDVSGFILTAGDKIGAETIWWSAYEQANRLGEANPILYADDVTRSAIAGRTKEDMSLAAQSQVLNLLFPFQVENVNLFNTLREQSASKKFGSLMTYSVAAFVFNAIVKGITNGDDEVLPEFITPIYEELKKALEGETEGDDVAQNILLGEVAEFLSLLPAGSSATQLIFGDDSETVFGDYDPNRYGVTNLGMSGIGNLVRDLVEHKDDVRQQAIDVIDNLVSSYVTGGKQATRTIKGIQSMGGLPEYKNGELETSPVNYTKGGKVAFVNDQENIADWIRAGLFGKWSTSEARKYIDSGFKSLSTTAGNVFDALKESGVSDFESFTAAQQYQNDKKQAKEDKANGIETDLSLRDQLMENGQYEDFKASVQQAYGDYLKDFDYSEGDPKSFKQFAASYGLDSDDLMNDTYKDFYDTYKLDDKTQKAFQDAMKIENVKNSLGDTINSSGATLRRMAYEEAGIYEDILKYIEDNGLEYSDFGLNKTVVGYNSTKMSNMLAKINKVTGSSYTYNGKKVYSSSSSGKRKSSGKSSSSSGLTKAQKRAMINIVKSLGTGSSSNVFSALDNILSTATSIEDVKKKVKAVQKKYS